MAVVKLLRNKTDGDMASWDRIGAHYWLPIIGELLTCAGDNFEVLKEHFEHHLNPTSTSPIQAAEPKDLREESPNTLAEVAEVIKLSHLEGTRFWLRPPPPKLLKAPDIVSCFGWHTSSLLLGVSGTTPVEWQTGMVVSIFKKGDWRVCSNYRVITQFSLPRKNHFRMLERRLQPIVKPQIQEEQCGFAKVVEKWIRVRGCIYNHVHYSTHILWQPYSFSVLLWAEACCLHLCADSVQQQFQSCDVMLVCDRTHRSQQEAASIEMQMCSN